MSNPDNMGVNELRGHLSVAVRSGNAQLEREVRHELQAKVVEAGIVRQLTGQRALSQEQVDRICATVRSFGPKTRKRAVQEEHRDDPVAV